MSGHELSAASAIRGATSAIEWGWVASLWRRDLGDYHGAVRFADREAALRDAPNVLGSPHRGPYWIGRMSIRLADLGHGNGFTGVWVVDREELVGGDS